jgi:hypothetical protein
VSRPRARAVLIGVAAAAAVTHAPASAPAPPGYTVVFAGTSSGGTGWDLAVKRRRVSGYDTLCLAFSTKSPDGAGFSGVGCVGGTSMKAWDNVFPVAVGGSSGDRDDVSLVGGLTVDRARKVVVSFADGKRVTLRPRVGPAGFRRGLGEPVRFFAGNVFKATKAAPRSVVVFDARGRQIGRAKIGR